MKLSAPRHDPAYAAYAAARKAGARTLKPAALQAAKHARLALAGLCECDATSCELEAHQHWCPFRVSATREQPTYDVAAQEAWRAMWATTDDTKGKP